MQTALIVDDSALARLTLKRFLLKHNLEVFEGESVADCRYWLRHNELPDVIFMDIMMPEEDGFEGLAEIRANHETKHLPVIMYSGDASAEAKQRARDGKATGYLRKPVNEEQLSALLAKLNERYSMPRVASAAATHQPTESASPINLAGVMQKSHNEDVMGQSNEMRELRHEVSKIHVSFEHQQESLTSVKDMMQRQANDLAHLQHNYQQNEDSIKKVAILSAVAAVLSLIGIVLFLMG